MPAQPTSMPMSDPSIAPAGRQSSLYRMMAWLSPGFPVGAFSFSHGLEAAVESGSVRDRVSLHRWIGSVVALGAGRVDSDILRDAYRAALAFDVDALTGINQHGLAFRATAETAVETAGQGVAFLETCLAAWPEPFLGRWAASLGGGLVCYAAAIGAATATAGVPLEWTLVAYLQAMAANLVLCRLAAGHHRANRRPAYPGGAGARRSGGRCGRLDTRCKCLRSRDLRCRPRLDGP